MGCLVDAVIEHDAVGVVDFMLNDDGVVAFEFDAFLFPIFCEILNRHTGMTNHIAWDVAV